MHCAYCIYARQLYLSFLSIGWPAYRTYESPTPRFRYAVVERPLRNTLQFIFFSSSYIHWWATAYSKYNHELKIASNALIDSNFRNKQKYGTLERNDNKSILRLALVSRSSMFPSLKTLCMSSRYAHTCECALFPPFLHSVFYLGGAFVAPSPLCWLTCHFAGGK